MNVLMASGVPRRREGGVAAIIYNLGRELERLGHRVTYVFLEDLIAPGTVSPRFTELAFSFRLARYIVEEPEEILDRKSARTDRFSVRIEAQVARCEQLSSVCDDIAWIGRAARACDEPGS